MVELSVIIPTYNNLEKVLRCLKTLRECSSIRSVEYLVQDDASTEYDGTRVIPPQLASVERNSINLGFSGNCNIATKRANGRILFFVNQDVYAVKKISKGWDTFLIEAFKNHLIGVVGARLLFPNGSIQSAGGLFDDKKKPFHRYLGFGDYKSSVVAEPREVSWVSGAALAMPSELFSGFDTSFIRGYYEDVDLCLRLKEKGYTVWYEPHCSFVHEPGSTGGNPRFFDNERLFLNRWVSRIIPDITL